MGQLPTGMVSGIVVVVSSNRKVQGGFELKENAKRMLGKTNNIQHFRCTD